MKVHVNDNEYAIEFQYAKVEDPTMFHTDTDSTSCVIRDNVPHRGDKPAPVVAVGVSVRYFKDPPNREVARKAALSKALTAFAPHNKEVRRAFWEVFLNRKKKGQQRGALVAELAVQEMEDRRG